MVVAVCLDGGVYGRAAHPASATNAMNERGSLHITRNHIESLLINQMILKTMQTPSWTGGVPSS